jgi:hypothetical protein
MMASTTAPQEATAVIGGGTKGSVGDPPEALYPWDHTAGWVVPDDA